MTAPVFDPLWLAQLSASAQRAPLRPRLPLVWGNEVLGSVEPDVLEAIADARLAPWLQRRAAAQGPLWRVLGQPTEALTQIALALRDSASAGVAQQWRDEQLSVWSAQGAQLATVERGAVRALGIATRAVHLVGRSQDGGYWVQQRALNKANDPGLWDTLMGGMVSAADSLASALERETWEEAGLRLDRLEGLVRGGRIALCKPCASHAAGYVVEQIDWFAATLVEGAQPTNMDGEVAQFLLLGQQALLEKLQRNEFTTEAALILVAALAAG